MILGIDPGVRKLGYALIQTDLTIVDAGILLQDQKSPTREDQFTRIIQIYNFFEKIIKKYKIQAIAMEQLFFTKFNQNNAEFVYGLRGALMMLFLKNNLKIKEITPIEVKKYITGTGKADKRLVQHMVMKIFGLQKMPEYNDAADALAMAYIANKIK
ncbi:MAG: crossover junction endodeoxyribonuclease RuvC [Candidatus Absconditabacteria bacterium]|nr:crossover junction endodeoxyribonuclease RuvC [Candidatus Absconditabacteria bacterium]